MTKRALVIGSEIDGLRGVGNDVRAIGDRLCDRGFTVDVRIGADASREGITDGYQRLVNDSRAGDPTVIYFSGHGCRLENVAPRAGERAVVKCLVPTDWTASGSFRGIIDLELSTWTFELTQKTQNVACVFDCCHAATISRSFGATEAADIPKVTQRMWTEQLREFLAELPLDPARLHVESNPHAVRLGAAEADRSAYEAEHELCGRRQRMGHFTWALSTVLDEVNGTPISWGGLMSRVRELVMRLAALQCPQLEGPGDRLLFSMDSACRRDAVVFFRDADGKPMLRASRLLGAVPRVVYELLPQTATDYDPAKAFATATVIENVGGASLVEIGPADRSREPQSGDLAFPCQHPFAKLSTKVTGLTEVANSARVLVRNSRFLIEPEPGETSHLLLIVTNDQVRLIDSNGCEIAAPCLGTPSGLTLALKVAERWSRSRAMLALESEGFSSSPVAVGWGRVEDSRRIPMCEGDTLYVGDRAYIDVENTTAGNLWLAIFDIGITGKVSLLTSATPTGRKLAPAGHPEARYSLGEDFGKLLGFGPGALPADAPQEPLYHEAFVVVVCTEPADFFVFETAVLERSKRGPRSHGFGDLLDWVREGSLRDFGAQQVTSRFSIKRLDFTFAPVQRWVHGANARGVLACVGPRESSKLKHLAQSDLRRGDILLSLGGSSISDVIHGLDGGWYSHAALWSGVDVIEATDPDVQRNTLEHSIAAGRRYLDVYRHRRATAAQCEQAVEKALHYVGRTYAWGDLLLGGVIVSSGSFLFRGRELDQRAWLRAMQALNQFLQLDVERAGELVTCVELVCRSYLAAGLSLEIDLQGLRCHTGVNVTSAIAELAKHRISAASKGGEDDVLETVREFRAKLLQLTGAPPPMLMPSRGPMARGLGSAAVVGADWGANLVTPRDLMQSPDLDLIGYVHP